MMAKIIITIEETLFLSLQQRRMSKNWHKIREIKARAFVAGLKGQEMVTNVLSVSILTLIADGQNSVLLEADLRTSPESLSF